MSTLEQLHSALDLLINQRSQLVTEGWYLQHCWLVQVKPGGNARTDRKYWQVRSRQHIFNGKTLKHLKPEEVENYRAAIERGRQLKRIDRQIEKLKQQLEQRISITDSNSSSGSQEIPFPTSTLATGDRYQLATQPQASVKFTDLAEQERYVREVLATSQALRASLRQSIASGRRLNGGSSNYSRK